MREQVTNYQEQQAIERQELLRQRQESLGVIFRHPYAWSPLEQVQVHDQTLYTKMDNRNPTGTYKWRGSYHAMSRLTPGAHIVGASAGNHMRGLVDGALRLGHRVTGFVPAEAPKAKLEPLLTAAARHPDQIAIQLVPGGFEAASSACAAELVEHPDRVEIHPFASPDVFTGQSTVLTEILFQLSGIDETSLRLYSQFENPLTTPDLLHEAIGKLHTSHQHITCFAPVGGGGLMTGAALEAEHWQKEAKRIGMPLAIKLIGVQLEGSNALYQSRQAGRLTNITVTDTLADGTAVGKPRAETFAFINNPNLVHTILTVSNKQLLTSMRRIYAEGLGLLEGAGALARAGFDAVQSNGSLTDTTVAVLCTGSNIDPATVMQVFGQK